MSRFSNEIDQIGGAARIASGTLTLPAFQFPLPDRRLAWASCGHELGGSTIQLGAFEYHRGCLPADRADRLSSIRDRYAVGSYPSRCCKDRLKAVV